MRTEEEPDVVQSVCIKYWFCASCGLIPKYLLFHLTIGSSTCCHWNYCAKTRRAPLVFWRFYWNFPFVVQLNLRQILLSSMKLEPCRWIPRSHLSFKSFEGSKGNFMFLPNKMQLCFDANARKYWDDAEESINHQTMTLWGVYFCMFNYWHFVLEARLSLHGKLSGNWEFGQC